MEAALSVLVTRVRSSYLYSRSEVFEAREISNSYRLAEDPYNASTSREVNAEGDKPRSERRRRHSSICIITTVVTSVLAVGMTNEAWARP